MPTPATLPGWERLICWHSAAGLDMHVASEICIYPVRSSRPMRVRNPVLIQALEESRL